MQLIKGAGSDGIFVNTDVTKEDDIRSLVDKAVKTYNWLDFAFNNAGIDQTTPH